MENQKHENGETQVKDGNKLNTQGVRFLRDLVAKELGSSNLSFNLDDNRITTILSTIKPPNHPPYAWMINNAIEELNEGNGSNEKAISEFITKSYENLPLAHGTILKHHLSKLCENHELVLKENEMYALVDDSPVEKSVDVMKKRKRKRDQINGIGIGGKTKVKSRARKESNGGDIAEEDREIVEVNAERNDMNLEGISNEPIIASDSGKDRAQYIPIVLCEEQLQSEEVLKPKKPSLTTQQKYDQSETQQKKLRSHSHLKSETELEISEPLIFSNSEQQQNESILKPESPIGRILRSHSKVSTPPVTTALPDTPSKDDQLNKPPPKLERRGRPRKPKPEAADTTAVVVFVDPTESSPRKGRGRPSKLDSGSTPKCDGRGRPRKPILEEKPEEEMVVFKPWDEKKGRPTSLGGGRVTRASLRQADS